MKDWNRYVICSVMIVAVLSLALPGCTPAKDKNAPPTAQNKPKEEHPTKGPHGGPLGEWGEDDFHVEFTVDPATKRAVVYVLDGTAEKAPKLAPEKISDMKLALVEPKMETDLKYDAQLSNDKGIAFVSPVNDIFAKTGGFKGNIRGKVEGKKEPYDGEFK